MSDLISRQDVYCILEKMMVDRPLDSDRWVIRDIDKEIKSLQSVDRPMGEWLARDCVFGVVYCSECGYELKQNDTHFCPNCGARMKGADDE